MSKEIAIHLINETQKKIDEQLYLIEKLIASRESTEDAVKVPGFLLDTVDGIILQRSISQNSTDESDLIVALNNSIFQ